MTVIEQTLLNPTSDKQEVMTMCLTSTKGDYQPISVQIPSQTKSSQPKATPSKRPLKVVPDRVKAHVPGRAGGGWESSEDEEEVQMKQLEELSIQSPESDAVENAKEVAEDKCVS